MWCVVLFITKRGRAGTLAVQILLHAGLFCCERVEARERQAAADAGAEVLEGRDEGGQELVVQVGVPQAGRRSYIEEGLSSSPCVEGPFLCHRRRVRITAGGGHDLRPVQPLCLHPHRHNGPCTTGVRCIARRSP